MICCRISPPSRQSIPDVPAGFQGRGAQTIGNDAAVNLGGMSGQFELNVFKPMMIYNFLMAARNLGDACVSFAGRCVKGIEPDRQAIQAHLENSLMLVTALNPHLGYEKAAEIAKKAYREKLTLRQAALDLEYLTDEEFTQWVCPEKMTGKSLLLATLFREIVRFYFTLFRT